MLGPVINSLYCAATNGTGYHLLKAGSKRRRTKAEIKDDKFEEELREEALTEARNSKLRMEHDLIKAQQQAQENANAAAILTDFMNKGQARINEKGQYELLDPERMSQFQ